MFQPVPPFSQSLRLLASLCRDLEKHGDVCLLDLPNLINLFLFSSMCVSMLLLGALCRFSSLPLLASTSPAFVKWSSCALPLPDRFIGTHLSAATIRVHTFVVSADRYGAAAFPAIAQEQFLRSSDGCCRRMEPRFQLHVQPSTRSGLPFFFV